MEMELLEKVNDIGSLLLLLIAYAYLRALKKIRYERKRTKFETIKYIIVYLAILLYASSYVAIVFKTPL